jgi:hypothetical protein
MSQLDILTAQAKEAAEGSRQALEFDSVEARRDKHLAYGRSLLAIRQHLRDNGQPSDRAFNAYLREHDLIVQSTAFRADAQWLAEHWDGLIDLLDQIDGGRHANPVYIRQWCREHGYAGYRTPTQAPRRGPTLATSHGQPVDNGEDEADDDEVEEPVTADDDIPPAERINWERFHRDPHLISPQQGLGEIVHARQQLGAVRQMVDNGIRIIDGHPHLDRREDDFFALGMEEGVAMQQDALALIQAAKKFVAMLRAARPGVSHIEAVEDDEVPDNVLTLQR